MSSIHRYFDVQLHLPLDFSTLVRDVSFLNFGVINCLQWLPLENQRDEGERGSQCIVKNTLTLSWRVSLLNESYVLPAEEVQPMLSCEIFV